MPIITGMMRKRPSTVGSILLSVATVDLRNSNIYPRHCYISASFVLEQGGAWTSYLNNGIDKEERIEHAESKYLNHILRDEAIIRQDELKQVGQDKPIHPSISEQPRGRRG